MKKLTILFALLTLSIGLWALDNVKYIESKGGPYSIPSGPVPPLQCAETPSLNVNEN